MIVNYPRETPEGILVVSVDTDAGTTTVSTFPPPGDVVEVRPIDAVDEAAVEAWIAEQARGAAAESTAIAVTSAREELAAAVELAAFYPLPTPEETAIVDAQVAVALDLFTELADPPADVVALAATVVAWRIQL